MHILAISGEAHLLGFFERHRQDQFFSERVYDLTARP
jgi:hypothetical protein